MGTVATSEIQAATVGRDVLRDGGSAVDAAIAVAACLTVTEPTSNGLGGDCFALVHDGGSIAALQANGASPAGLDVAAVRQACEDSATMPLTGWAPVTVPGQVAGWGALHARFGRLPWSRLLTPAIEHATRGFRVGPITAAAWARATRVFRDSPSWAAVFLDAGAPPAPGSTFRNPELGASLSVLADRGPRAFYTELGPVIAEWAAQTGGWLTASDFATMEARWVTPLSVAYDGWTVTGMTAPTQGVAALEALAILDGVSDRSTHLQIEAVKLAFADAYATVGDPHGAVPLSVPPEALLDADYITSRRERPTDVAGPSPAPPGIQGGTVLIGVVDDAGMAVSLIQSNFHGFGSGLVVPGTGIALQNRGAGFVLDPHHPNGLAAGKRPFHTILPGLVETPHGVGPFGCMGGQMQPQGHVQLITQMRAGISAQDAIDRARWRWLDDGRLALEEGFDPAIEADLRARGHDVVSRQPPWMFGGAQVIIPRADGLDAGSDPRKDGGVLCC